MRNIAGTSIALMMLICVFGCGNEFAKARVKIEDEQVMYRGQTAEISDSRTIKELVSWFPEYAEADADKRTLGAPWDGDGSIELSRIDGETVKIEFDLKHWRVTDPKPGTNFRLLKPGFWNYLGTLFDKSEKASSPVTKK